jgi:2-iminobutanoate/2-iminopropanoate deaminase
MREEIHVHARPVLSHSADAVRAGGLVFVAGILPVGGDGELVGGDDVAAQAEHVLAELGVILEAAGCGVQDVAKVNVFLTDVDDRGAIEPSRRRAFGATRPAATLVEVSGLAVPGARIEIDAVAVASRGEARGGSTRKGHA